MYIFVCFGCFFISFLFSFPGSHLSYYIQRKRGSRGRYRGRGTNRTVDRGYAQQNRTKEQSNYSTRNNNNQNNAPKGVRGRGPRRYQPFLKNKEAPLTQYKQ